jgi:Domain of unknown function (DUF4838)
MTASFTPLARGGLPLFEIHLPPAASAPEEFAAEDLRRTLGEMIGAGPRLRTSLHHLGAGKQPAIFVNDVEAAQRAGIDPSALDLGSEAYHLETSDGSLYLLGGGPRGVMYAVYDLLDRLGCRWFTPELSRIPIRRDLGLPTLNITAAPAFESRDTFNWECRDPLWWVRNRMNGWYTPVPEYMGGHVGYCGFVHTFYNLLPPYEFFDSHPEYYSLVAGTRRRTVAQLCLTNPDVLRIVTQRVLELMRTHPHDTIFSVSQNDCVGYCECEACQAVAREEGAQSGPILRFVNAVAAETSKVYPDKLIDTLAYWYSLDAPRKAVPHPNVRVRLCSINCCQGHAYGTCDHPESRRFMRALDEWGQRTNRIYIWHYATDFTHYPLPMPDFDELHDNIGLYQRYGVHGVFIQGMGEEGGGAESMALRGYLVSRLLWNPQQPVWPIVDQFLEAYYGAAAPFVRRYLDIFHDKVRSDKSLHPSLYDTPASRQFEADLTLPAEQALAQAELQVRDSELRRVRLLRGGLRYARLFRAGGTFRREGDIYHGEAAPQDLQEFDNLVALWKRSGVQRVREGESFDFTIQKLRNRLRPHRVEWLSQGDQRIAVVPDLGGRLLEWYAHDRQWLAPAEPDSIWSVHPTSGGYNDFIVLGMYALRGWGEIYHASWQGGKLVLTLMIDRVVQIKRRIWLNEGRLSIRSRLTNRGRAPITCGFGATLGLLLPDGEAIVYPSMHGQKVISWTELPETPGASLTLTGDQLPTGAWQIRLAGNTLQHEYKGGVLERITFGRSLVHGTLSVDLRTEMIILNPGKSIDALQVFWIQ